MLAKRKLSLSDKQGILAYKSGTGIFFTAKPTVGQIDTYTPYFVHACRDSFHSILINDVHFKPATGDLIGFIITRKDAIKLLNTLFKEIENKLGLEKKTVFYRTTLNDEAIIIKPSPFWLENQLRKSLFTLFVKSGAQMYNDKIDDLRKSQYFQYGGTYNVWEAAKYFLEGNTQPVHTNCSGFCGMFYQILPASFKNYLVKPKIEAQA